VKARVYRICIFAFPTISVITIIVDANPSITVCAGNNIYRLDNNSIYHQRRIPQGTGGAVRSTFYVPVKPPTDGGLDCPISIVAIPHVGYTQTRYAKRVMLNSFAD